MSKKSLLETNLYLNDPQKRHDLFVNFVSSSTAIETRFNRKMLEETPRSPVPEVLTQTATGT